MRALRNALLTITGVLLIMGCAATRDTTDRQLGIALEPNYTVVNVFFATDRKESPTSENSHRFGGQRGVLKYGTTKVSIPRDHRLGELEAPSIWRLEFRPDPEKHVVLLSIATEPQDVFFAQLASKVEKSGRKSAFLFVHGYNVSFEEAARRTAQISYDLGFDGAPVFYSWPSQASLSGYTIDEQNIEWAQSNLRGFLDDFFAESNAQHVYLIAHSMGNRALTRAVASLLDDKPELRDRLTELILTAPDIDADVFKRDIAPVIAASCSSVTLYASSGDKALLASKAVHGYPRAGDSGEGLVLVEGIETIDASGSNTDLIGHSYYAEDKSVLSDLFYLIRDGVRADHRFGLEEVNSPLGRYWKIMH